MARTSTEEGKKNRRTRIKTGREEEEKMMMKTIKKKKNKKKKGNKIHVFCVVPWPPLLGKIEKIISNSRFHAYL